MISPPSNSRLHKVPIGSPPSSSALSKASLLHVTWTHQPPRPHDFDPGIPQHARRSEPGLAGRCAADSCRQPCLLSLPPSCPYPRPRSVLGRQLRWLLLQLRPPPTAAPLLAQATPGPSAECTRARHEPLLVASIVNGAVSTWSPSSPTAQSHTASGLALRTRAQAMSAASMQVSFLLQRRADELMRILQV